ncbi:MAG TPA: DHA2 family efflux MFS transporter permease subunit [Candidatus Dormibacteraeota bacterium]|jgi:EmrB/QacA subfamily drug resistance transporter|nr:DHA2 family efflux MFS transporter permease subunit [Candidatus Dormibacteraeota bacterium]
MIPSLPFPNRSRWAAFSVLCAGMLMIVIDGTIVNVALPSIQRELDFSESALAWVVNAYLIPFGGVLLLAGRMGDLIGRRRIFIAGLAVFTVASTLCGLSQTQGMLIAARLVQGVGGGMTSSVILGMVVTLFPGRREQARAIGVIAFICSAGGSVGLLMGGVLTEAASWHGIFFVNLPIGIAATVLALRLLEPERGIGLAQGADLPGAALVTTALMLGVYTIAEVPDNGWGSPRTLILGGVALALLAGFLVRQTTAATPLLPLAIFRSRSISGANVIMVLAVAGMFGTFFIGALYLRLVLGYGPLQIGLAFLPVAVSMGAISFRISAQVNTRFGARPVLIVGLAMIAVGLAAFGRGPAQDGYLVNVLPSMLLLGIGGGLAFPAVTSLGMSGATADNSGLVSGLVNTTQQVGGSLGLAVLATLTASRTQSLTLAGAGGGAALTGGYLFGFAVGALFAAVAIVVAVLALPAEAVEPEAETEDGEACPEAA